MHELVAIIADKYGIIYVSCLMDCETNYTMNT